ncbi:MAG: restriction endonuclease [Verrucomicrobiota bacterium]|jgi:restriction system protein
MKDMPKYADFWTPVLKAMKLLGGSGTVEEIKNRVVEVMGLTPPMLDKLHDPDSSNMTEVEYRLAWARTYLKNYGLLENSARGVWALTKAAEGVEVLDVKEVRRIVGERMRKSRKSRKAESGHEQEEELEGAIEDWRKRLYALLTKEIDPSAFERLVQRVLREAGFIQVEVTGRSGDGGIDGRGIARIHGFMSFHVVFQCKRYQGVVTPAAIRDFRGAMVGRADKGLFLTTGTFSKEAVKEATRDGAPPIDLIDGDALADKLKEYSLGVSVRMVEDVSVNEDWFKTI